MPLQTSYGKNVRRRHVVTLFASDQPLTDDTCVCADIRHVVITRHRALRRYFSEDCGRTVPVPCQSVCLIDMGCVCTIIIIQLCVCTVTSITIRQGAPRAARVAATLATCSLDTLDSSPAVLFVRAALLGFAV